MTMPAQAIVELQANSSLRRYSAAAAAGLVRDDRTSQWREVRSQYHVTLTPAQIIAR